MSVLRSTGLVTSLLIALAVPGFGTSRAATTVALLPDHAVLGMGDVLHLFVAVGPDGPALSCFNFSVEYDPAVLRFERSSEGTLFTASPDPTFFSEDVDMLGRPRASGCVLGFGTSVNVPGEIAVLDFTVVGSGTTSIALRDVVLRDVDREELAHVTVLGSAVVAGTTGTAVFEIGARLVAWPNPARSLVSFDVRDAQDGARYEVLDIVDVAGRRVRRLAWPVAANTLRWDGRDAHGRSVAAGIYFATLRGRAPALHTRVLRIDD